MYQSSASLLYIYNNVDLLLLILVRILGGIYLIPIFSRTNVPVMTKIGFCFIISVLIFSSESQPIAEYFGSVQFFLLLVKEFVTGLIISFTVYLYFSIFNFAGQLIDYQIGFSMANVVDPMSQTQVPITGNLIHFVMLMLFIQLDGLDAVLYTIFDSYNIVPIGGASLIGNRGLMEYFIVMTSSFLVIGANIAIPIVGTILLVDTALGLLVKAVPQMNVFVVGMPIKLLIGLVMLIMITPILPDVFKFVYFEMINALKNILEGM